MIFVRKGVTMSKFYDGSKIMSLKDLNGELPEIYMICTNRSAGKTTFFGRYFVKRFIEKGEKFGILYRFGYEMNDCADKFFKEIGTLFFPEYTMTATCEGKGTYYNLYLNDIHCGYCLSINKADMIKKMSHLFSDIQRLLFDEFQSETNNYCSNEITKFISIHTSIARGGGKQVRYLPVYMLSNPVSLLNPYFSVFDISSRLQKNTKFLRGDGWVLESGFYESASMAQKQSAFNRAFASNKYVAYSTENVYLNDTDTFIEKVSGNGRYVATLKFEDNYYAIREFLDLGIVYCDDTYDPTFPRRIAVTTDDHQINYVMLKNNEMFLGIMKQYFQRGVFRFKNIKCKNAIINALSF